MSSPPRLADWPSHLRQLAVVLWTGFLGAVLWVLALLLGWDYLHAAVEGPDWPLLGGVFVIGWWVSAVVAGLTWMLAPEPRPVTRLTPPAGVDEWQ